MGGIRILACAYRNWAKEAILDSCMEYEYMLVTRPEALEERIREFAPNLILFYGWSWMVPEWITDGYYCVCCHPSKLPAYRGGSPLQHQIMDGETESAVTFFRMTQEMDAGPILSQIPLSLEGSLDDIFDRIGDIAETYTEDLLDAITVGIIPRGTAQTEFSYPVKRRRPDMSEITHSEIASMPAEALHNKIRALSSETEDYPTAYIVCGDGQRLYLTASKVEAKVTA